MINLANHVNVSSEIRVIKTFCVYGPGADNICQNRKTNITSSIETLVEENVDHYKIKKKKKNNIALLSSGQYLPSSCTENVSVKIFLIYNA